MNNFDDVDTYLEHFGKKGMRWGVSKGSQKGLGAKKVKLKTETQKIKEARYNTKVKLKEIDILGDKALAAKTNKKAKVFDDKADTKMSELLKSENYKLSKKLTRGEKIARNSLKGAITLGAIGIAIGAV